MQLWTDEIPEHVLPPAQEFIEDNSVPFMRIRVFEDGSVRVKKTGLPGGEIVMGEEQLRGLMDAWKRAMKQHRDAAIEVVR